MHASSIIPFVLIFLFVRYFVTCLGMRRDLREFIDRNTFRHTGKHQEEGARAKMLLFVMRLDFSSVHYHNGVLVQISCLF